MALRAPALSEPGLCSSSVVERPQRADDAFHPCFPASEFSDAVRHLTRISTLQRRQFGIDQVQGTLGFDHGPRIPAARGRCRSGLTFEPLDVELPIEQSVGWVACGRQAFSLHDPLLCRLSRTDWRRFRKSRRYWRGRRIVVVIVGPELPQHSPAALGSLQLQLETIVFVRWIVRPAHLSNSTKCLPTAAGRRPSEHGFYAADRRSWPICFCSEADFAGATVPIAILRGLSCSGTSRTRLIESSPFSRAAPATLT